MRNRVILSAPSLLIALIFSVYAFPGWAQSPSAQAPRQAQSAATPVKDSSPQNSGDPDNANDPEAAHRPVAPAPPQAMQARRKFVADAVDAAVGLPAGDPQDRLRVLAAAADVMSSIDPAKSREFASEGVQLEIQLILDGQKPAVSLMERSDVKCSVAQDFVEMLPVASVPAGEQSVLGALSTCPRETLEPVKRKLAQAMQSGDLAPRALLATMQAEGLKSRWSIEQFQGLFESLPADANQDRDDAPNFAAMFARVAPQIDRDAAGQAGLDLLEWLGKLDPCDERNLAVNITTGALQDLFGEEKYRELLGKNVMALQAAQTAGQPADVDHGEEENVSVLRAMDDHGTDQLGALEDMPPSLRAREAAAHGFAAGTGEDPDSSKKYFDMAFSALDEVWQQRDKQTAAPEVVEEVSEAAAQVDPVMALRRTQGLADPAAQAIGMLAVARVALSRQIPNPPAPSQVSESHSQRP